MDDIANTPIMISTININRIAMEMHALIQTHTGCQCISLNAPRKNVASFGRVGIFKLFIASALERNFQV